MRSLDLEADVAGNVVGKLSPYRPSDNRRLVESAYRGTPFLAKSSAAEIERVARVPDQATCRAD